MEGSRGGEEGIFSGLVVLGMAGRSVDFEVDLDVFFVGLDLAGHAISGVRACLMQKKLGRVIGV